LAKKAASQQPSRVMLKAFSSLASVCSFKFSFGATSDPDKHSVTRETSNKISSCIVGLNSQQEFGKNKDSNGF